MAFTVSVDRHDSAEWHELLRLFDDAVIHQSWSFGAAKWGEDKLSHLVLEEDGTVVAAAQVAIARLPTGRLFQAGIAHVKFGPLWRRRGQPVDERIYRAMLRALREEYSVRRGLVLRLKPWETDASESAAREAEGFRWRRQLPHYRTYVLDMAHSMDELHDGLKQKWRYNLRRAGRQPLTLNDATHAEGVRQFTELYREMHAAKGFYDTSEAGVLEPIFAGLPPDLRPRIWLASSDSTPVGGVIVSLIGSVGFYLFGATNEKGRGMGASYLLHWKAVGWLKEAGCRWYDLVGAYPALGSSTKSEGIRQFKAGLVGRSGREVHMGDFDACHRLSSRVVVDLATNMRYAYRDARHLARSWRRSLTSPGSKARE